MKTNSVDDLPHWARKAMGYTALGYSGAPLAGDTDPEGPCGLLERLAKRVAARWPDIEKDVLPSLAVLSNNVKGRFFREIFRAGMRSAGDTPRAARQEVRRLDAICEAIAVKAGELADLLEQQAAIDKDGLAECDMPYLAELLLDAGVEYPVWSKVATSTEMLRFWTVVFGQTGPGPELADVLRALVQRRRGGPFDPPLRVRATEPAFRNRQASQSDHVRTLLRAIDEFPRRRADGLPPDDIWIWGGDAVCLPHGFDLPDSAVTRRAKTARHRRLPRQHHAQRQQTRRPTCSRGAGHTKPPRRPGAASTAARLHPRPLFAAPSWRGCCRTADRLTQFTIHRQEKLGPRIGAEFLLTGPARCPRMPTPTR
jgi:hypothetical protein